ncbi:MAG: hypothetical protein Q7S60_05095 [bacterium]|nr:hypothetical protein [bacterium]
MGHEGSPNAPTTESVEIIKPDIAVGLLLVSLSDQFIVVERNGMLSIPMINQRADEHSNLQTLIRLLRHDLPLDRQYLRLTEQICRVQLSPNEWAHIYLWVAPNTFLPREGNGNNFKNPGWKYFTQVGEHIENEPEWGVCVREPIEAYHAFKKSHGSFEPIVFSIPVK